MRDNHNISEFAKNDNDMRNTYNGKFYWKFYQWAQLILMILHSD